MKFTKDEDGVVKVEFASVAEFRECGLLWYINRVAFHPHGIAMSLGVEGKLGMWGNMDEPWTFTKEDDDKCFTDFQAFLRKFREEIERAK